MTTQTVNCSLMGPGFSYLYTATCTDDTFTTLLDSVNGERLGLQMEGLQLTEFSADYAAGSAMLQFRNIKTSQIVEILPVSLTANNKTRKLPKAMKVMRDWTLEAICVAVPT